MIAGHRRFAPRYVVVAVAFWLMTGPLMAMVTALGSGELVGSASHPGAVRGWASLLLGLYAATLGLATVCALGMLVRQRWAVPAMAGLFVLSLLLLSRLVAVGQDAAGSPYLDRIPVPARLLIWLPPLVAGVVAFVRGPRGLPC